MKIAIARFILFVAIAMPTLVPVARAQAPADSSGWHYQLAPYFMFPNMKGETGVGTLPDASVDEDPGDIFSNLNIGAMLYGEMNDGKWTISSDVLYMKLSSDLPSGVIIRSGEAEVKQLGWEVAVMRRVSPWLEAGLALTLNRIGSDLSLVVNTPGGGVLRGAEMTQTWVDPSLVARATFPFAERWFVQPRVNLGGFGIGSDLFWQAQADLGYRFSPLVQASIGYRVIDVDYESGEGADRFRYDMTTFGSVVKVGFNF